MFGKLIKFCQEITSDHFSEESQSFVNHFQRAGYHNSSLSSHGCDALFEPTVVTVPVYYTVLVSAEGGLFMPLGFHSTMVAIGDERFCRVGMWLCSGV